MLLAVVTIGVLSGWVRAVVLVKNHFERESRDLFAERAGELYEENNLDGLLAHCEHELKDRPNNPCAIWYRAKVCCGKRDFEEARKALDGLGFTEPTWRESHVKPFLKALRELESEAR